ncbi:MarR family winged helix-turn-helix transcriptional regulator [Celeribacter indicus]|uniref:Putative Transcriptional regulator, MarR family protein n=1 Tax=Celeribacter indicus TaxID=1208324 RepID=A0A0B5E3P5_9RHOB|nr:MarR family transcriptional regulator [Celeribacter indicus]AJE47676.1 putative Transcriptional regulator, MarR family protein [Celeribacter indicus]SDW13973.1 transcriptional regulator, MarR family [Celeribacter indicus]
MLENDHSPAPLSQRRGLGASLRLAHHLYGKLLQKRLVGAELSMAQYIHLRTLREEGRVSQSELSAQLGLEKASSTRVLDELAQRGLIHRERHHQDRRMIMVSLTAEGRAKIDQSMTSARAVAELASRNFDEGELLQLFTALDKMIGNLASEI